MAVADLLAVQGRGGCSRAVPGGVRLVGRADGGRERVAKGAPLMALRANSLPALTPPPTVALGASSVDLGR